MIKYGLILLTYGVRMPLWIMCFNLKDGVSEEEFVKKSKELFDDLEGKVEGFRFGKLYRHHLFGAHRRTYQMHTEFKDFTTLDKFLAFEGKDAKAARLLQEWQNLIDFKTHYDDFVREIPL